jgi:hypothetical protein
MEMHCNTLLPPHPNISPKLYEVLKKATEKDQNLRYQNSVEFKKAIENNFIIEEDKQSELVINNAKIEPQQNLPNYSEVNNIKSHQATKEIVSFKTLFILGIICLIIIVITIISNNKSHQTYIYTPESTTINQNLSKLHQILLKVKPRMIILLINQRITN